MYRKRYHIHFVGIGGIGMSGIAELLLNLKYKVTGSDIASSDITRRLQGLGGIIHEGHAESHIQGADVVVVSSAIGSGNPEVVAAEQAAIPVIPRAEMLARTYHESQDKPTYIIRRITGPDRPDAPSAESGKDHG